MSECYKCECQSNKILIDCCKLRVWLAVVAVTAAAYCVVVVVVTIK